VWMKKIRMPALGRWFVWTILAPCVAAVLARSLVAAQADRPTRKPTPIAIRGSAVALNPSNPTQDRVGPFVYAGGLELNGIGTNRLHGLSDLAVLPDNHLVAVTDEGDMLEARVVLDARGRLSNVEDGRLSPLVDLDGRRLRGKRRADAEGLAVLPNGDRLVSFEREHRIWLYRGDSRPVRVAIPAARFPDNEGIEALVPYAPAGADAYLAGSELGMVWLCSIGSGCTTTRLGAMVPQGYGLTGMAAYDDAGSLVLLARAYDDRRGARVVVRVLGPRAADTPRLLAELRIEPPLTRDNFEGVAAIRQPGGVVRIYIASDDNFSARQHTYLLAFDWRAPNP
jgi:hypothetical protein